MYDSVTGLLRVLNILISPVTLWGGNCNAPFPKIDGCGIEAVPWRLGRNWAWDIRSGCWLVGHRDNGLCGPAYNILFSLILLSLVSFPQPPCSRGNNHSALFQVLDYSITTLVVFQIFGSLFMLWDFLIHYFLPFHLPHLTHTSSSFRAQLEGSLLKGNSPKHSDTVTSPYIIFSKYIVLPQHINYNIICIQ